MNILKNKAWKSTSYISRYSSFPYYYNTEDKKYICGLTEQLNKNTSYVLIDTYDSITLDYLAYKYYGRPDYYWVIAYFNDIQDVFEDIYPKYKTLKIPSIASISFEEQ